MLARSLTCGAGVAVAFGLVSPAAAFACEGVHVPHVHTPVVDAPVNAPVDVDAPVSVNHVLDVALADVL